MKNKQVVEKMVDEVMNVGIDHTQIKELRAKLYRRAGLELVDLAALIEAEVLFAD